MNQISSSDNIADRTPWDAKFSVNYVENNTTNQKARGFTNSSQPYGLYTEHNSFCDSLTQNVSLSSPSNKT